MGIKVCLKRIIIFRKKVLMCLGVVLSTDALIDGEELFFPFILLISYN